MGGSDAAGGGHEVRVAAVEEGAAETAAIRLVGMVPAGWSCEQRLEGGQIVLWLVPSDGGGADAVDRWLAAALTDPALRHWRAVGPRG